MVWNAIVVKVFSTYQGCDREESIMWLWRTIHKRSRAVFYLGEKDIGNALISAYEEIVLESNYYYRYVPLTIGEGANS